MGSLCLQIYEVTRKAKQLFRTFLNGSSQGHHANRPAMGFPHRMQHRCIVISMSFGTFPIRQGEYDTASVIAARSCQHERSFICK